MQRSDELRYRVIIKKSYKLFFVISTTIFFIMAIGCIVLSIGKCETVLNDIAAAAAVFFFLFCGYLGICSITKRVEVYKGKVLYYHALRKKEYRLSDIFQSDTKEESLQIDHGDGNTSSSWDMVTYFYDAHGKKLFSFGLAYDNIERLKKDVENTQKSIAKSQKSNQNRKYMR